MDPTEWLSLASLPSRTAVSQRSATYALRDQSAATSSRSNVAQLGNTSRHPWLAAVEIELLSAEAWSAAKRSAQLAVGTTAWRRLLMAGEFPSAVRAAICRR
jgi:hypothetical protein